MNKIFNNYFRYTAFADDSSHHDDHVDGAGNKHSQGIKYLGVARKEAGAAGDCVVIASFAKVVSHKVDKYAIKKAITNIQSDQHCSFAVGESVWSVLVDDINLVYILTCSKEYPQRCAVLCLQELQTIFRAKAGHKCFTSSHDGLSGSFHSQFSKLFEKYNDTKSVDSVIRASSKVDGIKLGMLNVKYCFFIFKLLICAVSVLNLVFFQLCSRISNCRYKMR